MEATEVARIGLPLLLEEEEEEEEPGQGSGDLVWTHKSYLCLNLCKSFLF